MRAYDSILVYGPPDSTAALYTVDGILFIPGMQPLQGRQAILDFLSPIWASSTVLTAKTTVDTVQVFGGHGAELGDLRGDRRSQGPGPVALPGAGGDGMGARSRWALADRAGAHPAHAPCPGRRRSHPPA